MVGTPIPYLLAVLLTAVLDRQRAAGNEVTREMVHAAFEEDLLGGATAAVFQHYRSRLDQYYSDAEARVAKVILGALSRSEKPMEQGTVYQLYLEAMGQAAGIEGTEGFLQLMNKLENDFYVVREAERFRFFSRVLGAWWKARYGFFATKP